MTNLLDEDRGSAVVEYGLGLAFIGLIVVGLFLQTLDDPGEVGVREMQCSAVRGRHWKR